MATIFSFTKPGLAKTMPAPNAGNLAEAGTRDWSNQELSNIYRAVASLGQAGILVHMDRGQTDEGDPWMVLCRLDGEVFLHFCRLDGRYLLDSPALASPLRGQDFADLIDLFISQAARAAAPNVVAFRASKVFLHPAALLTILVWSLYVWSSDTTDLQAGEWGNDEATDLPASALLAVQDLAGGARETASQAAGKPTPLSDHAPTDKLVNRLIQAVDQTGGMPAGNNIAAMQMLAVMGTMVLSAMGTHTLDPQGDSAVTIAASLPEFPGLSERPAEFVDFRDLLAQSGWDGSDSAKALLSQVEDLDPALVQPRSEFAPKIAVAEAPIVLAPAEAAMLTTYPVVRSDADPVGVSSAAPIAAPADAVRLQTSQLASEFAAIINDTIALSHYQLGGVSLLASFDPAGLGMLQIDSIAAQEGLIDLRIEAPQLALAPAIAEKPLDNAARAFIDAFLAAAENIQVLASANELVLIDLTAFDDTIDRAFAYSWTLEDGGVISTLGHYDFFAGFALV